MISPQLIRRLPFFAGLSEQDINTLANVGEIQDVKPGHIFFHEQDTLTHMYINLEGAIGLTIATPKLDMEHSVSSQLTHKLETEDTVLSAIGPGELFGWSALVPSYEAMAGAKALSKCRVIAFESAPLLQVILENCDFGYMMMMKIAQVMRSRLRDKRIESLSMAAELNPRPPEPVPAH